MSDDYFAKAAAERDAKPKADEGPPRPTVQDLKQEIFRALTNYRTGRMTTLSQLPHPWPPSMGEAIDWWLGWFCEPERRDERPHLLSTRGAEGNRWEWNYRLRVMDLLYHFLRLDQASQEALVKAREYGVNWRGESLDHLRMIAKEQKTMKEMGVDGYIGRINSMIGKKHFRRDFDDSMAEREERE